MNGEDNDCQPGLALPAKSCASYQLLPQQHSDFSALAPVAGRYAGYRLQFTPRGWSARRFAPSLFHFALYEQLRNAVCVITRKNVAQACLRHH
jgi:hypothetical protein